MHPGTLALARQLPGSPERSGGEPVQELARQTGGTVEKRHSLRTPSRNGFPRTAVWGLDRPWHERDVAVPAFCRWLEAQGWTTETEKGYIDVVAHRGGEAICAEVKGRTKGRPGGELDKVYGQLLRRMSDERLADSNTRLAVVVYAGAEPAALRVSKRVRDLLQIDVYSVDDDGHVEKLAN